jgi:hypothetical protein
LSSGAAAIPSFVNAPRTERGPLITIRYVILGRKGRITFVVKVDNTVGTSRWTITSATKGYTGLRGEGIETPNADYTVSTLTGTVSR